MRIDGSVKTNTRQALVNDFQNNHDLRAAVLSIQAAGTGLTLTVRFEQAASACQSALSNTKPAALQISRSHCMALDEGCRCVPVHVN